MSSLIENAERLAGELTVPHRVETVMESSETLLALCAEVRRLTEERDEKMDEVGLPRTASLDDLIRHHKSNAALAVAFDVHNENARLREALEQIAAMKLSVSGHNNGLGSDVRPADIEAAS